MSSGSTPSVGATTQELNHVDPSLAALIVGYKRLRFLQLLSHFLLGQRRALAKIRGVAPTSLCSLAAIPDINRPSPTMSKLVKSGLWT
jgi:hypothetical protein